MNLKARLTGTRVYLRFVTTDDATVIRKWHNDPEILKLARDIFSFGMLRKDFDG